MKKKIYLYLSFFILLIYLSPHFNFFISPKILIGDNLNHLVAINKILSKTGSLFIDSHESVPYIMGGIKRGFLKSELNFSVLSYKILPVEIAYSVNRVILHLVAFFSFILLLKRYVFKENDNLIPLLALGFSTLPFFSNSFLTIAGQPLLLYCYLNVFNKKDNFKDWLVISLFPFFSSLVLGNVFFLFFLTIYYLIFIFNYKFNLKIIFSFLIFILSTIICEYRLFELFFFLDFESFRIEMLRLGTLNFKGFLGTSLTFLLNGHRHFATLHYPIILVLVFYSLFKLRNFKKNTEFHFLFCILIFSTFFENFFYGWSFLNPIKYLSNFLNSFTFRFYSIFPLVWYLLFSISLRKLKVSFKFSSIICFFIIINNFFGTHELSSENSFYHSYFNKKSKTHFTIKNYYSEEFINGIKNDLNINSNSKIACLGFPSIILNYNDISTVGGFLNNYPLENKHTMGLIMKNEFKKSNKLSNKFNNYGVYCEIQSSELILNNDLKSIKNLNIDLDILKKQGCSYIFSTNLIENFNSIVLNPLPFINPSKNSYLNTLYIYKLL